MKGIWVASVLKHDVIGYWLANKSIRRGLYYLHRARRMLTWYFALNMVGVESSHVDALDSNQYHVEKGGVITQMGQICRYISVAPICVIVSTEI